ncbi:MAG: hypothetical protein WD032_00100 [Nitrospirales bacterium]
MTLDQNEICTHFVFGSGKIRERENDNGDLEIIILPAAFQPHRERNDLSVSRISDLKLNLDERSIWFIGKFVEKMRHEASSPSNLYGRGDLRVSQIQELKLKVHADEPPPRHANITNFPPFSRDKESESFNIQQKLACLAEGFVIPEITYILNENVAIRPEFSEFI